MFRLYISVPYEGLYYEEFSTLEQVKEYVKDVRRSNPTQSLDDYELIQVLPQSVCIYELMAETD